MKTEKYVFKLNDTDVIVNFAIDDDKTNSGVITYCMILVKNTNGKIERYCSGTVCNPHDKYDYRKGLFIAFKKALRLRWDEKNAQHWGEKYWKLYHQKWSHLLSALMDNEKKENGASE